MRRTIAAAILAAFLPVTATGCFGGFELTKKVYKLNEDVSPDKWVQEVFFLVLVIVPIYGIASFLDAILFNSIEFWTGNNPVLANGGSQSFETAEGRVTLSSIDAATLAVTLERPDGTVDRFSLARENGTVSARDADGAVLVRVDTGANGAPAVIGGLLR